MCLLTTAATGFAQTAADSSMILPEVKVSAFARTRYLSENPSPVSVVGKEELDRYGNVSLLPALNAAPGVRMEERSPGSYRLSIRGSSLRSPFGVRNVKVYYNNIPLTDPGGFTYFNQLSIANVSSVQVLKGPSGSLYGQGNGGVLLIGSMPETFRQGVSISAAGGSYGLRRGFAEGRAGDSSRQHIVRYEHLNSEGYRQQSALSKRTLSYDGLIRKGAAGTLDLHLLYNKLEYGTPGALTQKEYEQDPRSARPYAGTMPGSIAQDARIMQENILLGLSATSRLMRRWEGSATVYGLYSGMENAAIRNYSTTTDPHFGGRATLSRSILWEAHIIDWVLGAEIQQGIAASSVYANRGGTRDTLQTSDEIRSGSTLAFTQLSWKYRRWAVEAGACVGRYTVFINRTFPRQHSMKRPVQPQLSPRLAALYRLNEVSALYVNLARGYSSPTVAELAPSGSNINTALRAEQGMNYEAGVRGTLGGRLSYDISAFYYQLRHAIVLRKDSAGGDNYVNAGTTQQLGLEAKVEYRLAFYPASLVRQLKTWAAFTAYDFRYSNFVQETNDFSGKHLPGTAPHALAAGADLQLPARLYLYASYYGCSRMALNDANTAYSEAYHLLGIKCSYKPRLNKIRAELFVGADNLLNQAYSLGNDINAAGGRYFNAAMPLNVYAGCILEWLP